ncbi:hypothetical protein RHMOL_Rhmol05G0021400 [Rhododendron molle]|uniref:Uncharacterized protein n=1 Tax=Rhododendron molle TaxID=49168 RepID=A0ACC0NLY8_RHOML|nr:hypothetical protein RHMOL_Rhmol05G0021400 [Rhododendron molle]
MVFNTAEGVFIRTTGSGEVEAGDPCYFIADGAWDADSKRGATAWVRYGNGNVRITQDVTEAGDGSFSRNARGFGRD